MATTQESGAQREVVPGLGPGTNTKPNKPVLDAKGAIVGYTYGNYAQQGESGSQTEELTPEKKAAEKETKEKLGTGKPMPKQADYPEIKDFAAAMRVWREQNRTAKDAAGAVANRPK
jgi:hypothetical protein